jgi:F420-0:gamma-glutamyl ligase-like protein
LLLVIDSATSRPKTGDAANLTAYVSIDAGTFTALTDTSATEMDATNAPGLYLFDLTQAETNGDHLLFTGRSSTSGVDVVPQLFVTFPATGVLAPTVAGRTLDVNADGEAGIDWANLGGQSTTVNLSATTVKLASDAATEIATAVGALVCDTGVTLLKSGEMIAALCAGQLTSTSGAGTQTLEYMKRDGVTPSFNTVVNMADKTRSTTGSLS